LELFQSYKLFRSLPNLTHLTIKRQAAQNESFIDISRQFGLRRKHVLIHPDEGEMKKIKCWLIPKMFINWKQNFYLVKIYRVIFVC